MDDDDGGGDGGDGDDGGGGDDDPPRDAGLPQPQGLRRKGLPSGLWNLTNLSTKSRQGQRFKIGFTAEEILKAVSFLQQA